MALPQEEKNSRNDTAVPARSGTQSWLHTGISLGAFKKSTGAWASPPDTRARLGHRSFVKFTMDSAVQPGLPATWDRGTWGFISAARAQTQH